MADSGTGLDWLRWVSPLGWIEQLQPLTAPHPLALLPIAGLIAVLSYFTVRLAGERDLGGSTFPDRSGSAPHTRLCFGPSGLNIRLMRSTLVGWGVGIAAYGLILGLVAKSGGSALSSSASMTRVLSRLGATGAYAYLGLAFLMMAVILAIVAAGQVGTARGEEAGGRLDHFLVRPVSRSSWLAGRLLIATAVLVVGGLLAGACTWLGAASQHTGVGFASVLDAGLNVVPPAVCLLGIGAFVFGVWPRASIVATYGILVWSFLVELIGGVVGVNHWLLDASLFHQMAAAPAVGPDWATGGVLVAIGAVAAVAGGTAFAHRDLKGE